MTRPHLIVVGGFLGAGKTTLILAAARLLAEKGIRSAIILNDQGDSIVDTELARSQGLHTGEVTGGCFCCRFSELMSIAEQLRGHSPDVIFAEPAGSCTDLSATILHPIQQTFNDTFQLAPLTVLVDPGRAHDDPDVDFLFRKQLEEADLICFNKSDLYPAPSGPGTRNLSARTGEGVAAWLDEVMLGTLGGRILDIDYNRYAQAEASLAWLNAEADFITDPPVSPAMFIGPLIDTLDEALTTAEVPIVHLKALNYTSSGVLKAAICANGEEASVEGALDASPTRFHHLILNLRAVAAPERVRPVVESALSACTGLRLRCFSPAAPKPEYRVTG